MWATCRHTASGLRSTSVGPTTPGIHQSPKRALCAAECGQRHRITPPQFVSATVSAPNPAVIAADGTLQSTITSRRTRMADGNRPMFVTRHAHHPTDLTVAALPTSSP